MRAPQFIKALQPVYQQDNLGTSVQDDRGFRMYEEDGINELNRLSIPIKLILIVALIIFTTHCNASNRAPSPKEIKFLIEKEFGKVVSPINNNLIDTNVVSPDNTNLTSHLTQIEVYLDGTGSISGFIISRSNEAPGNIVGQTTYCSSLTNLRAVLSSIGIPALFFKFGANEQGNVETVHEPTQAINNVSFYNQLDTRVGALLRHVCERPIEELPEAFIIVTDGVQSTPQGSDFTEVIAGVSKWLGRGFSFEILGFVSEFHGYVYSEIKRASGMPHKLKEEEYNGQRPFYWYVFSIKPDFGKKLNVLLRDRYAIEVKYLSFSSNVFEAPTISLEPLPMVSGRERNPLGIRSKSCEPDVIYIYWRDTGGNRLSGNLRAKIDLKVKKEFSEFQINPQNFKFNAECLNLRTRNKITNKITLSEAQVKEPSSASWSLECIFTFDKPTDQDWYAWRITLFPEDTTFCPPQWVKD